MNVKMEKKFVTNIYDPNRPDFFDKFLNKKIPEKTRQVMIEKIKEYLKQFEIGAPKVTNKMNIKAIESKNIVGLYSLPSTSREALEFFSFQGVKRKIKKNKITDNTILEDTDYIDTDLQEREYSENIDKTIMSIRESEFMDPIEEMLVNKINEMIN